MGTYYIHQALMYWKEKLVWLHLNQAHKLNEIQDAKKSIYRISKKLGINEQKTQLNIYLLENTLPWPMPYSNTLRPFNK